jgi:hypothetical protein
MQAGRVAPFFLLVGLSLLGIHCIGEIGETGGDIFGQGGSAPSGPTTGTGTETGGTETSGTGIGGSGDDTTGSVGTGGGSDDSGTGGDGGAGGSGDITGSGGYGGGGHGGRGGSGAGGAGGASGSGGRAGSGGGGMGGMSDSGITVPFATVSNIVGRSCGRCHSSFRNYSTLTTRTVSRCGGDTLAKAFDPANSAVLELVTGKCTILMPRGCSRAPCIPQSDIDTLTRWINEGARNN